MGILSHGTSQDFPCGSVVKKLPVDVGDACLIPG